MRRTPTRTLSLVAGSALALGTALTGTATAVEPEDVPTFEEFRDSTYQDPQGVFVVNGDEPVGTERDLSDYYQRMIGSTDDGPQELIVNTVGGYDDLWSSSQARDLTYCVSTAFGSRHDDVVAAMAGGAGLWESASSGVNFVHVSSQDGSCTTANGNVLFSVEPVVTTQYIARAFFPSTPKSSRNVLIDSSIWSSGSWTPSNILGHELGHTLGFRHEHTRPEAGTCFEDNNWRPLTPYDSASIMHYPQCNGSSSNLSMTATDRSGVRSVYGS